MQSTFHCFRARLYLPTDTPTNFSRPRFPCPHFKLYILFDIYESWCTCFCYVPYRTIFISLRCCASFFFSESKVDGDLRLLRALARQLTPGGICKYRGSEGSKAGRRLLYQDCEGELFVTAQLRASIVFLVPLLHWDSLRPDARLNPKGLRTGILNGTLRVQSLFRRHFYS